MNSTAQVIHEGSKGSPTRTRREQNSQRHSDLPFIGMVHVEANSIRVLGTVPASTMKSSAVHFQAGNVLYGRLRPYINKVAQPGIEGLCSVLMQLMRHESNETTMRFYVGRSVQATADVIWEAYEQATEQPGKEGLQKRDTLRDTQGFPKTGPEGHENAC